MKEDLKNMYKIEKTELEKAFEKQMMLKKDPEYQDWAEKTAIKLIEYFENKYKGLEIEIPKLREKSAKSLYGKIKNLQIERLSKLYIIDEATEENKQDLYDLIEERIDENKDLDKEKIMRSLKELIYDKKIDLDEFENNLMVEGISNSTKTAMLRILVGNIQESNYDEAKKEIIFKVVDGKYGKALAEKTKSLEDDLIKYESINTLKNNPKKVERLKNELEFLKANDLRGMKIVVTSIPDDFETQNNTIKELLKERKFSNNVIEKRKYTKLAIAELGKEFYNDLANDEELLKQTNMQIIPNSNKHKKKKNGYEAEHVKFINKDEPEYTLEMQFKSIDVEDISKGNGSASHMNRPGKQRILPHANNDEELKEKLEFSVPKYTTFTRENGKIVAHRQDTLGNILVFFQEQLEIDSPEYNKIMSLYKNKEKENEIEDNER